MRLNQPSADHAVGKGRQWRCRSGIGGYDHIASLDSRPFPLRESVMESRLQGAALCITEQRGPALQFPTSSWTLKDNEPSVALAAMSTLRTNVFELLDG